jgi:hypothetical protein
MRKLRTVASGIGIAGALGLAALGIGVSPANAAPPSPVAHSDFADWRGPGWHEPGPWLPPPPPPPPAWGYNYGGYAPPPPCVTGPLGFLQFCA